MRFLSSLGKVSPSATCFVGLFHPSFVKNAERRDKAYLHSQGVRAAACAGFGSMSDGGVALLKI
jgi:hypothetical protein